jgi:hypothetical protein
MVLIQGLSGCITWILQTSSRVKPLHVYYCNNFHKCIGFIVLILGSISILN